MILGLSDTEKKFKTAMDTAGADMTVVNSWIKLYVKNQKEFLRCCKALLWREDRLKQSAFRFKGA